MLEQKIITQMIAQLLTETPDREKINPSYFFTFLFANALTIMAIFEVKIEYTDITFKAFEVKIEGFKMNLDGLCAQSKLWKRKFKND